MSGGFGQEPRNHTGRSGLGFGQEPNRSIDNSIVLYLVQVGGDGRERITKDSSTATPDAINVLLSQAMNKIKSSKDPDSFIRYVRGGVTYEARLDKDSPVGYTIKEKPPQSL